MIEQEDRISSGVLISKASASQRKEGERRTHVAAELSISDGLDADGLLLGNLVLDGEVLDLLEVGASARPGVELLALLEEIKRACREAAKSAKGCDAGTRILGVRLSDPMWSARKGGRILLADMV